MTRLSGDVVAPSRASRPRVGVVEPSRASPRDGVFGRPPTRLAFHPGRGCVGPGPRRGLGPGPLCARC
eukprot:166721-Chlamydomonas_euryale.AAC.1